jgi:DNA-binding beta-propeller fold protein YncE
MRRLAILVLAYAGAIAAACGSGASGAGADATPGGSDASAPADVGGGSSGGDAEGDAPQASCPRPQAPADRPRKVVISHPFGADAGDKATEFEVLDLAIDGTLSRPTPAVTFSMGTALDAPIVFTPDGEIGLVAQDDGSLGVFRLGTGAPVVLEAAYKAGFYARAVIVSADGTRAWVLDANTADNGGGVYELAIGCDGKPASHGLVVSGGNANAMTLLPGAPDRAVLAARKAYASADGKDLHVVDLAARTLVGSAAPFGDVSAIPSSIAVTPDGKYALVADDGILAGNRIAVAALAPSPAPVQVLSTPYPAAVVASPYGNAALVLNDDSTDQIHVLSYDASNTTAPFAITGELAYKFGKPQIPVTASTIDRGSLKGAVFVSENVAVRQLRFEANGTVTDVAKLASPSGTSGIVGVVGVQP